MGIFSRIRTLFRKPPANAQQTQRAVGPPIRLSGHVPREPPRETPYVTRAMERGLGITAEMEKKTQSAITEKHVRAALQDIKKHPATEPAFKNGVLSSEKFKQACTKAGITTDTAIIQAYLETEKKIMQTEKPSEKTIQAINNLLLQVEKQRQMLTAEQEAKMFGKAMANMLSALIKPRGKTNG